MRRGFTLLEVMVAVTILGLGLTMILSSQTGLFASAKRVQNETLAISLLRCKMSEVEEHLDLRGYSLIDQNDSGPCCEDEDSDTFSCDWKVETVELPAVDAFAPPPGEEGEEGSDEDGTKSASTGGKLPGPPDADPSSPPSPLAGMDPSGAAVPGALGVLGGLESGSTTLSPGSGLSGVASTLGDASEAGPQGMVAMAMSLVYPNLKPMLEASIRKVTVSVRWKDGQKERDLTAVQYVTNPLEGSLNPNAAEGAAALFGEDGALAPGTSSGTDAAKDSAQGVR